MIKNVQTVLPKKKNFRPDHALQYLPWYWKGFALRFRFHENCWQPWGSEGHNQIWKVGGVTAAGSENNRRAALIGARAAQLERQMMVYAYTNDKRKGRIVGNDGQQGNFNQLDVMVEEWVTAKVRIYEHDKGFTEMAADFISNGPAAFWMKAHNVRYEIQREGDQQPMVWEHPFDFPWHGLFRAVGGYYGGRIATTEKRSYDFELKLL